MHFALLLVHVYCFGLLTEASDLKNVLYIVVDDLRPQLGAYGQSEMYTPNIDKLASQSLVFERAYCQQAVCAPSRNSFMTGRRPDTTKAWNFIDHFREAGVGLNWSSMPQYFKNHGYFSSGVGKLYHKNLPPDNDPPSWSDLKQFPYYWGNPQGCPNHTSSCPLSRETYNFTDMNSTAIMMQHMHYAAQHRDTPFFLGIGFHKPHLSWRFPQEFLQHYPNASNITVAKHLMTPAGMPTVAYHTCIPPSRYTDLHKYEHNISVPYPVEVQQHLRQGYYSAVSYMDSLVGEVLRELDSLGLSNDTIVAFHADHGWQLGEHNEWCKQTNFELAARVPFMIRAPGYEAAAGKKTSSLVELVDVFPTLVELAGLPPCQENLEGKSLAPLFKDSTKSVKNVSLTQYPRCGNVKTGADNCGGVKRTDFEYMGYSIRTDRYRYTEWVEWNGKKLQPNWENVIGKELYDHQGDEENDFDAFENENVAEKEEEVAKELSKMLRESFSH
ncbi:iduronate 2-sulfatase-like [Corticium candelabrum]|uniref:iduronate 2-sulfatase-like n=1 Tax=Corticium candelabrum TaxID=121492 RepID=UPI002E36DE30|nr:iduronate 2-sulfatase-like [Corticium candelabrum]